MSLMSTLLNKFIYKYRKILLFLFIGLSYLFYLLMGGMGIPCLFHLVTGFNCPGCGITRLILNLAKGNVVEAFHSNPFIFISIPFLIYELMYQFGYLKYKKDNLIPYKDDKGYKANNIALYVYLFLLVCFGIARNIFKI